MTAQIILGVDFRARREREAAELEVASEALSEGHNQVAATIRHFTQTDTSPSEMNPQDGA